MSLRPEVQASYVVIIDSILTASDLNTVTSKRIREGLQKAVDYDIVPQKDAIKALIMQRFDKFVAEQSNAPLADGHPTPPANIESEPGLAVPAAAAGQKKRKSESGDEDDEDVPKVVASPSPKKKRRVFDDDAAFAARLQAEENSRARPTRGGAIRKAAAVKKKTPKKKTAARIKPEDDSELDGSGSDAAEPKKINRSGGFHKLLNVSPALSVLLDGETQISRPQCVSRLWKHIKARGLQDPSDKRWIRCDEPMKAVFRTDKVHMMTMNKTLNQNLYNPDE